MNGLHQKLQNIHMSLVELSDEVGGVFRGVTDLRGSTVQDLLVVGFTRLLINNLSTRFTIPGTTEPRNNRVVVATNVLG